MSAPLPRPVTWLLRLVAPRCADEIVSDLEDDYARVRARRRAVGARWWLVRETTSLLLAYLLAPISRLKSSGPLWIRDLRLVLRGLRRGGFAAIGAAAMLSTGLLAVLLTAGLSKTLLLRQVSATHGDALRRVGAVNRQGQTVLRLSYVELQVIRDHLNDVAEVTAVNMQPVVMHTMGADVQTMAEVVDGRYFKLIGTNTIIGRGLLSSDDRPDASPVTVVSEPFWRKNLGASPSVLGQTVKLNGHPFTVVGIARTLGSSSFLGASVDTWVSIAHADALLDRGWQTNVDNRWFTSFVLPHASVAEVDGRLAAATVNLARSHPIVWRDRRLQTSPATALAGSQRRTVMMLLSVLAGLGLLILATAASNVGGLLLARAVATRRHVAIHLSIGAGRAAIVRRQLIEGAIVGLIGACISIAFYVWARKALAEISLLPTLALRLDLPLDTALVLTVAGVGIAAGMTLALGLALWATRVDLAHAIRDAQVRSGSGRSLARMRGLLVSTQVCMSLALIVGAALFLRSLTALVETDLGFARDRLVAMDFDLEPQVPSMADLPALARDALARAQATPGVVAAAMSNRAPIDQSTPSIDVRPSSDQGAIVTDVTVYLATSRYFETVGIPIVTGRAFTTAETDAPADVVIVNETLAARVWPDGDVLDRALYLVGDAKTVRVVGVARNSKYRTISEPPRPHIYRPTQPRLGLSLLARSSGDPRETLRALQRTLNEVGPGVVGFFPRTLDDHLVIDLLPTRAAASAASLLASLALVLSAVGLYGLVSWFVELRRREIGVRMALGARPSDVRRLVMRQAISTALPGMAAGLILSVGLAVFLRSALFGVGLFDPIALLTGVGALAAVVLVAAYFPTRRATRVDPVTVLRDA